MDKPFDGNATPLPDFLVNKYGVVTAVVWGIVYRAVQHQSGICSESLDAMASVVGVSKKTVFNHLKILCADGYVTDLTPKARYKPHQYVIDIDKVIRESYTNSTATTPKLRRMR